MSALRRAMAWGQYDDNERAVLESNDELRESVLGPEVDLDSVEQWVYEEFWKLRNATHAECGIAVPEGTDTVLELHLRALDAAYREERANTIRQMRSQSPPKPPAQAPPPMTRH